MEYVVQILEVFYKATHVVSRTDYPTKKNLFISVV